MSEYVLLVARRSPANTRVEQVADAPRGRRRLAAQGLLPVPRRPLRNRPAAGCARPAAHRLLVRAGSAFELPAESRPAAGPSGRRSGRRPTRGRPARAWRRARRRPCRLLATRNSAMSPTALDVGVTLTMSPNSWLTRRTCWQTSGQRSAKPNGLRLLEQVGVLSAGHLVAVDVGRAGRHAGFRTARRTRARLPSTRRSARSCSASSPVSRGVKRSASTIVFRFGCEVHARHRRHGAHRRCRAPPRPP